MKKKKLTLNQTWTQCLRMWRWITEVWQTPRYKRYDVGQLKKIWLKKNGFNPSTVRASCFFCEYKRRKNLCFCYTACPGALVDPDFVCDNYNYHYAYKPVEFYKELLRLNKIRKAKKNGIQ